MERAKTSRPIHFDKVLKILQVYQSPVAIKRAVHIMNYQSKLVRSLVNYHILFDDHYIPLFRMIFIINKG
jgi:hypothetical protein